MRQENSPSDSSAVQELLRQAQAGHAAARDQLFETFRTPIKRMIRLRLNQRLQGRFDPSDLVQETYLEASKRLSEYLEQPRAPFHLWLRRIAADKLLEIHRNHLETQARDAQREIPLALINLPSANSSSMVIQLLSSVTPPLRSAMRSELERKLASAIEDLAASDREILSLRHFEQLSNMEVAAELGIAPTTASKRYLRSLSRLREKMRAQGIDNIEEIFGSYT